MEAAAGGIFELSLRKVPATRQLHLYSERISGYFSLRYIKLIALSVDIQ